MPRSSTSSKAASPTKRSRSRSRGRPTADSTQENSRASSPGRRGRPAGSARSRSPPRITKAMQAKSTTETASSKRNKASANVSGQSDTSLLRPRKSEGTTTTDGIQNRNGTMINGTRELKVAVENISTNDYVRKLRSADAPKINTSIFENISLTPSKRTSAKVDEKPKSIAIPSNLTSKLASLKTYGRKSVDFARQVGHRVYENLPSWKIMVAFLLVLALITAGIYVYAYKWEAARDYYIIVKEEVRRRLNAQEKIKEVHKQEKIKEL